MKSLFLLCLACCAGPGQAQQLPLTTQQQLEQLADATGLEAQKDHDYLEQLDYYRRHPLPVNTAAAEDLQALQLLTDLQIGQLLSYRKLAGYLLDLHELQAVPGWDLATIEKLLPYLTIAVPFSIRENLLSRLKGQQRLLLRAGRVLERAKGYGASSANHYLGSGEHLMLSYRYQYKNLLYFGLSADKDPGEQFFRGAQSGGFDFYSVHFFLKNMGLVKALALGDYTVNLGQGLISWQSGGLGKSADVMAIKKQGATLNPYRGVGEYGFNRGVAIALQHRQFEATLFGSYKKISGSVDTAGKSFGSLLTTGYYRTPSEVRNRYGLSQLSWGGQLSYENPGLRISVCAMTDKFSLPWQKREEPYNYFAFSGQRLFHYGAAYSYTRRNMHWFGELAADQERHLAYSNGVLISADPKIDISILHRKLDPKYAALPGHAFTENTTPANEEGAYAGMIVRPVPSWQVSAYADVYRFPWLRYRVHAPSLGHDYLVQLNYQAGKRWAAYIRYRDRNKPVNDSSGNVLPAPGDRATRQIRIHLTNQLSPSFSVQARVEMVWLRKGAEGAEEGFLVFAEASGKLFRHFSADLRVQYFETGSYDSRIYAYESDVLYGFSIPAFFTKGYRYYLNLQVGAGRQWSFWLRCAQSLYPGMQKLGIGLEEIRGNRRTEVKLQVIYQL